MPRYDEIFDAAVTEAVIAGEARFDSLVRQLASSGMSERGIVERVLRDLDEEGPIFGPFLRQLGHVGQRSAAGAQRLGTTIGEVGGAPRIRRAVERFGLDIRRAETVEDPDLAFDIEQATGALRELMWVAELRATCRFCLPMHGTVRTAEEWAESGDHPDTIHAVNSIDNPCYCVLVDTEVAGADRTKALAPLKRVDVPLKEGEKLNRKTVRDVSSKSAEASIRARDKLVETLEGRRALRKLGQVKGE